MKTFNKVFTILVLIFLYIPMIVLGAASFNSGSDPAVWKGFTFANYGALFQDGVLLPLLLNSFIVAVISSMLATILGTMASLGIHAMGPRLKRTVMGVTNIPLTNPEIVTGVSLALLFAWLRQFAGGAGLGGFLLAMLLGCGIAAGLACGRIARLYAMAALAAGQHARR